MSLLISCSNCWHNALQFDQLGLRQGYCIRHNKILNRSGETTCGQLMRKDLPLDLAREENTSHRRSFPNPEPIVLIRSGEAANGELSDRPSDIEVLRQDEIAEEVRDYGHLGTTIESLASLGKRPDTHTRPRAELAFLCLARGYITNCVERGDGKWTAGLNLFRWTRNRLAKEPIIQPSDLRFENQLPLNRKVELAQWSLITMRLMFIVDLALLAQATEPDHPFGQLADTLDLAAADIDGIHPARLLGWIDTRLRRRLNQALPSQEVERLISDLNTARPLV